jgi:hypothetical protein
VRSGTSSSTKTPNLIQQKEMGPSPRSKPVKATVRSEVYYKNNLKSNEPRENSLKTMRPPCRQSDNLFDLDDLVSKNNKKVIRIVRKQPRPPSRHKTPPKAVGLEFPPPGHNTYHSLDIPSPKEILFNTQPFHMQVLNDQKIQKNSGRAGSVKGTSKYQKNDPVFNSRAWSAKQKANHIPIILNKRKLEVPQNLSVSIDTISPFEQSKRSSSKTKNQNFPVFTDLQAEFMDLFA